MLIAPDAVHALVWSMIAVVLATLGIWKRTRLAVPVVALALIAGCLFGGRTMAQGLESGYVETASSAGLRALSWNAAGVDPPDIARRLFTKVEEADVAVVVLPETGDRGAEAVSAELTRLGWNHTLLGTEATSILIDKKLDDDSGYELMEGNPPWAGVAVRPSEPGRSNPVIVATHIQQPSPGNLETRIQHLEWVTQICDVERFVLAMGDFNATLNHLPGARLGGCSDIAAAQGAGAAATWPTWLPAILGISIDRAMVTDAYEPAEASFAVLRDFDTSGRGAFGADHWPILVTIY